MTVTTSPERVPVTPKPSSNGSAPNEGEEPKAAESPDTEVKGKARRRNFSVSYKVKILNEADACANGREVGALLRREGLYHSHLSDWRKQRDQGALEGLKPKKRGRKRKPEDPSAKKLKQLEAENRKLKKKLERAELMLDVQKKASEFLGITLKGLENDESDS